MSLPITNQPHNTQELDEILGKLHNSVLYFAETGAGNPFEDAEFAKDEILDWHNKQVEAVLDRLETSMRGKTIVDTAEGWQEFVRKHVNGAIEAERNKLKGVK